jgi:glycosidase
MEQRRHRVWAISVLALLASASGCGGSTPDASRACRAVIWGQAQRPGAELTVVGSWDDWARPVRMQLFDGGPWVVAELALAPGEYGYLVVEEGRGRLDPYNPASTWRVTDDAPVSSLRVEECHAPAVVVESAEEIDAGVLEIVASFVPAVDGAALEPTSIGARLASGETLSIEEADVDTGRIRLRAVGLPRGKHVVEIDAGDAAGRDAVQSRAVGWIDPRAREDADQIIYQVVVDRFRGDDGVNLSPPPSPGARAGGTLRGVLAELERGTFDALGVSTLWLSPPYLNPDEAREGLDGRFYEGYHGYWVLDTRAVDPRIGGEQALDELVAAAHARGMRVLLDLVPNHLYEDNPRVSAHAADGWFNIEDPPCICGTASCPWDAFIQTCWFTSYLPDVRFEHPGAMAATIEDTLWWYDRFGIDGFRIDAVPMMPRAATRRILEAVRRREGPDGTSFHLGEIFTGPGAGGTQVIRYYLGPHTLDSAFDFPLMWALRDAVATERVGFEAVESILSHTETAIAGSGSHMAPMIGNHDVTRFASVAHGDAERSGWGPEPAAQPEDPEVYARVRLAMGLVLTLPGVPILYYGDEIGLAGGGDPDCRRVMPADETLRAEQLGLRDAVRRMGALRRCLPALRAGARIPFAIAADRYAFARIPDTGDPALVLVSRALGSTTIPVPSTVFDVGVAAGWYKDALSGERFALDGDAHIDMPPLSMRILIPEGNRCG